VDLLVISIESFAVLLLTPLGYWVLPHQKLRTLYLCLVSLGLVAYWDKWAALVVVALTSFTYGIGYLLETRPNRKLYRTIGVAGLLLALVLFKYLGFLGDAVNSLLQLFGHYPHASFGAIVRPLGISYLVFKLMSYLIDLRKGVIDKGKFLDVLLYGSLFTIFVAGPIERFKRLKPQLESEAQRFKLEYLEAGFQRIVFGLFKKTVIADWIGYLIIPIWRSGNDLSLLMKTLGLVGFSFQLYLDFAGYSDIAIGASKLYGLTIMENFDWPYLQPNLGQFWRHWHISLSSWIRDYIFYPLGRKSTNRIWTLFIVPVVAMGLSGLWHEASWRFLLWGVWHGLGLSAYLFWNYNKRNYSWIGRVSQSKTFTVSSILVTYIFFAIGLLWFG
jgi:alginate O-acetyltransferase complex protein AlgI